MNENSKPKSIIGFTTRFIVITIAITLALSLFFSKGNLGALFNGLGQLASTYSHPHAPNLDLVIKAPLQVKIHLCAVLMAIGLGIFQLAGLKGSRLHRFFGWSWVIFMLTAAVSSLIIYDPRIGLLNPLYGFSIWTLFAAPMIVFYARRHNVEAHSKYARGLFLGGLLVAGAFALLPGRLMWQLFFG